VGGGYNDFTDSIILRTVSIVESLVAISEGGNESVVLGNGNNTCMYRGCI
jgi:hypothetical protein